MAKPDNRADNVAHLQQHVQNTEQNLHEAEQYLDEHADEISATELNDIQVKNEHRKESLQKFQSEIQDEANQ
ncbi:small acid-soluble spore protein Tlp [Paenibacillus methanolicus]|uniref:Small acid-soluble spore protein (Thioredoxin-like protein) n=1 Tax=Paenibacillus methanolicus TaxID=582686 RepID=A0A5S5C1R8_9BACL|nr:small acid-soluble spore protein Tlp [Paenibacillus methanolicus]TYP72548.1 small acid-soluble spore protein (thioredoxin-like protein) [Paenibacillus methanolicus]